MMPLSIPTLRALAIAGASAEMIIAAVEAQQAVDAMEATERREKNAARMRATRALQGLERARTSMHIDAQSCTSRTIKDTTQVVEPAAPSGTTDSVGGGERAMHAESHAIDNALSILSTSSFSETSKEKKKEKKEGKERAKSNRGERLPADWLPKPHHYAEGEPLGLSRQQVNDQAEDMRLWARSNEHRAVARKSNWDLTFSGWMRRNGKNYTRGPPSKHGRGFLDLAQELERGSDERDSENPEDDGGDGPTRFRQAG